MLLCIISKYPVRLKMSFGASLSFILGQVCSPTDKKNSIWYCVTNIWPIYLVFVMGMIIRYDDPRNLSNSGSVTVSPFTIVFENAGLQSVAHIMNAVILITVSEKKACKNLTSGKV